MNLFRFRRHHSDTLTGDQRERMAVFSLSGETEGAAMLLARRHLEFARDLAQHGRIGEDDGPTPEMIARAVRIPLERPR